MIAYGGVKLGDAHRIVVENYLSSKYDLPIIPEGDFYGFDTEASGDYDFFVTGIGVENEDTLRMSESAELVISELDSSLDDGEFLFVGHLNEPNTLSTEDLPAEVGERFARVWATEKTGSVNARFTFDYALGQLEGKPPADGQYALLYSATQNPYNFSVVATNAVVQGSQVQFDLMDSDLQNGYYTLGAETSILVGNTDIAAPDWIEISIAPNPAPGYFTLRSPQATIEALALYDLTGRRLTAEISHDHHEAQVRSSYRGLAIIKVRTDQGTWVQKVQLE